MWYGLDLCWAYSELLPGITRQTYNMQLSYDVLHDALLRFALTKNPQRIEQPQAYFRTIVKNILVDAHREMTRFVPLLDDGHDNSEPDNPHKPFFLTGQYAPSTEHLADLQQRLQALQRIIDCLPPRCREVFWLFRIEGLGQVEIAKKLEISLNMVERHMIRALVDLRMARDLAIS